MKKFSFGRKSNRRNNAIGSSRRNRDMRVEPLEDRNLLSVGGFPELPGMQLVDSAGQFEDQTVYLNFDGAQDVTYNGPIVVENIDIPAFEAPADLAGQEPQIIADIVAQLETTFADTGIIFTTAQPAQGTEYSTVYVGGNDSAFSEFGQFLGLAENVDAGNLDRADDAFVFSLSESMTLAGSEGYASAIASATEHEVAHLLGYKHTTADMAHSTLEDYAATFPDPGKISDTEGNFLGLLEDMEQFGWALAEIGDLDDNGVKDLAVGVGLDWDGGAESGSVWILFLGDDGNCIDYQKISSTHGGFFGGISDESRFGTAIAPLGDLDQDGVEDIAVGDYFDHDGGNYCGAVWILFLEKDGSVKSYQKISNSEGNLGVTLDPGDCFGSALGRLGDMNGDHITDLAVGAWYDDDGGTDCGAVYVLYMNRDGTVSNHLKIANGSGGFDGTLLPGDGLGGSVVGIGDLDGNGYRDLVAGAQFDDDGGIDQGAMWIMYFGNVNGKLGVEHAVKISELEGGFTGDLSPDDNFGYAAAEVGDLDDDGVVDLAVSAPFDDDGGVDRGAVWILYMNQDGTVKGHYKISQTEGGFTGQMDDDEMFGLGLAHLGTLPSDVTGFNRIAVGAGGDNDGGVWRGAVWQAFLPEGETSETDPGGGGGPIGGGGGGGGGGGKGAWIGSLPWSSADGVDDYGDIGSGHGFIGRISSGGQQQVPTSTEPPVVEAIADLTAEYDAFPVTIPIVASDVDGNRLTYCAHPTNPTAYNLDVEFELTNPGNNYYENQLGLGEKYFRGKQNRWYYILPDGGLYEWGGSIENSILIGTIDPDHHTYPALLHDAEEARNLDNAFALRDPGNNYYENARGLGEKYLRDEANRWYYMLPDGRLYLWGGSIEASTFRHDFDADFYHNPAALHDAANVVTTVPANVVLDCSGSTLTIDPANSFVGDFGVTVTVSDGFETTEQTFNVSVTNASAASATPYDVDAEYDLYSPGNHYYENVRGLGEKYFRGEGQRWFYILPNGQLYRWEGSIADSSLIASLDSSCHAEPSLLHDAQDAVEQNELHGLYNPATDYTNVRGLGEKYFQGNGGHWFFILPNGEFYRWGGSIETSKLQHTFGAPYHDDTALLYDAEEPVGAAVVALVQSGELSSISSLADSALDGQTSASLDDEADDELLGQLALARLASSVNN